MLIPGDEHCPFAFRQRQDVVVAGVGRAESRSRGIRSDDRGVPEKREKPGRIGRWNLSADLGVRKRRPELGEQQLGYDELEIASHPARDDLRRRTAPGEKSRDEDVRVEDGAHSATWPSRFVLSLDGDRRRLVLGQIVVMPEAFEQVESELAPKSLLDDLTVTFAAARRPNLDGAKHLVVDRKSRSDLRHRRIIAS